MVVSDEGLFSAKFFVQFVSDQLVKAAVVPFELVQDVFYRNCFFCGDLQVVFDAYIVDGADAKKFSLVGIHKLMVHCVTQCVTA